MSSARKTLALVEPDLQQMETLMVDLAAQQFPLPLRADSLRDRLIVEDRALCNERDEMQTRLALLNNQFEAVRDGFIQQITDIDKKRSMIAGAIGPVPISETQENQS